jgi:hypothetical protein
MIADSYSFRVRGSENWRALLRTGANMLIVGPRCALDAFVAAAADDLPKPVRLLTAAEHLPKDPRGTLVVRDASRLDERQHEDILAWLDAPVSPRPQLISLSEMHLWSADGSPVPLDLYYRLNTICLELETHGDAGVRALTVTPRSRAYNIGAKW